MCDMKKYIFIIILLFILASCNSNSKKKTNTELTAKFKTNQSIAFTKTKALEIIKSGFNAGDGYREVWIRDYNTFIELAAKVYPADELKANLMIFFKMQGSDGNIIDGFTPREDTEIKYDFTYSDLAPNYAGHKNSVETDQESSLIQAVYKYIQVTDDKQIIDEIIGEKSVAARMEWAMNYLMENRFSEEYGLIWGATTADWGDVQPEHSWGVDIDENTHRAIDIYDNAMFIIALNNLIEMLPQTATKWTPVRKKIFENCRKYLWDSNNQRFIPHIYLNGSPFPKDFNENEIYYFGGTAIAIEAGLLSKDEILISINEMVARVKKAGAGSIGLTLYPPYPEGFFKNKGMYPYGYQNGGDWTWFGGRMIQQLVKYDFLEEAYEQLLPMTERVLKNDGFFEWYTINNEPRGSGTFRGSAGVLFVAIELFENELF
jgi:glycogen debranching enzyme